MCRLIRHGEKIHLEPKVMQVLAHLVEQRGRGVSRRLAGWC